jgi:hypothetical protein
MTYSGSDRLDLDWETTTLRYFVVSFLVRFSKQILGHNRKLCDSRAKVEVVRTVLLKIQFFWDINLVW